MSNTKEILEKYNIKLDTNKSQNYLIDDNKLNIILENADIQDNETILEIGAGIGTLTLPMAKKAKKVIAIEKDPVIVDILKQQIIKDDALKVDFPKFDKVVSNLPYQISSPVTFKLLEYPFKKAILMYQLEFAKRMQAKPDTHEYSRLSVALSYRADTKIIDTLPPEAFIPKPKIKSAVIELIPKNNKPIDKLLDNTIRALFQHRNKKAKKALIQSAHELGVDKKVLKQKLSNVTNDLFEEKVFKLTPTQIKEISLILEGIYEI